VNALAQWTATQQISALFVAMFGLLTLATAAAFFFSVREGFDGETSRAKRVKRDLRALWIGALVFWLGWVGGAFVATVLCAVFSLLALREFVTLAHTRRGDHRSLILAFFIVLPLQYLITGTRHFDLFTVFIPVYVFLVLPVVSALAGDPERFLERNAKLHWGIMVCVYGLSHLPALLLLTLPQYAQRGAFLLFFLVMVAVAAQLAQEAASRWLRRRPLARQIDRSFSLRAWCTGVAAAAVVGAALSWITPFDALRAAAMAAIAGGAGTLGELVMRALKKDAGVRYWGNTASVTGAVGLLDRVAPLCFAAPVFFHSVRWYFQLGA
jgi:phosphatidate cytidylyltransferase